MEYQSIISEMKQGKYRPIYFLHGEEPYFIDKITSYIEQNALDEDAKGFNQHVVYGKDNQVDTSQIISLAKGFPMFGDRLVVIVKEAQHLKDIDDLLSYVLQHQPSTVLVINYKYKKYDGKKKLAKELKKQDYLFESKSLYDNQVPAWIQSAMKAKGYQIGQKASFLLSEFLGTDLGRIEQELDKLSLLIAPGGEVSEDLIEKNVGISKDFNNFELQKAIGSKNIFKSNQIIQYFSANPKSNPMVVTTSVLYSFFSKLLLFHGLKNKSDAVKVMGVNPYFIKDYEMAARNFDLRKSVRIIGYLRDADARSKGIGNTSTSDGELLKELLFKILH
ncbi:MAG: DNA polymerase-3 subunit delta [Flavobacteriales bacterium]|jgi:DNA polymerase-3 subunit delta